MKIIPVSQYKKFRKDFSLGTIKSLILHREENGLIECVVRISGRLYLVEEKFDAWILNQTDKGVRAVEWRVKKRKSKPASSKG